MLFFSYASWFFPVFMLKTSVIVLVHLNTKLVDQKKKLRFNRHIKFLLRD